jgi:uncharacterized damage-inducible protein DinB
MMIAAAMLAGTAVDAQAQGLSSDDRARLKEYLVSTRDQVVKEASTLTEAQWSYKPGPDRWSVGEVVEHLALTEPFLFELHEKTLKSPAAPPEKREATKGKDEAIRTKIPDRTNKVTAPEPLKPGGSLGDRTKVLAAFEERRAKTLDYVDKTTADLRAHVSDQSPLGPVDSYQWLLYIAAHTERHLGQIREVKASAQFPKSSN